MTDQQPIKVMIVDDHAVVRSGLGAFLTAFDDLELVAEAGGGQEALRLCRRLDVDVILMDLVMPEMDGAAATRAIRQECPHVQVIALTSFKEEDLVQGALQAGAISYLLKNVSAQELADAIDRTPADVVVIGSPVDLRRVVRLSKPSVRVRYELQEIGTPTLDDVLAPLIKRARADHR